MPTETAGNQRLALLLAMAMIVLVVDTSLMNVSIASLEKLLTTQPEQIRREIVRINTDARPRALQVALLIPILAGLIGLLNAFRMVRVPDPAPPGSVEDMVLV